jgi:hypothetical protein
VRIVLRRLKPRVTFRHARDKTGDRDERFVKRWWITSWTAAALVSVCLACGNGFEPSDPDAGSPTDAGSNDASVHDASGGPPVVGDPCRGPADCVDGATCIGTESGEFRCMSVCDDPYSLCDDGSICTPVSESVTSVCYIGGSLEQNQDCASNLECAPGLLCFGTGDQFYCRDGCETDTGVGCLPGEYCRGLPTGAGICRPTLGESCATAADCPAPGLECSAELEGDWDTVYPGGYCTTACQTNEDCSIGSRCVGLPTGGDRICLRPCEHVSDCRFNEDYRCVASENCSAEPDPELCTALTGPSAACLP